MPGALLSQTPQEAQSLARNVLEQSHGEIHNCPLPHARMVDGLRCIPFVRARIRGDEEPPPYLRKKSEQERRAGRRFANGEQNSRARIVEERVATFGSRPVKGDAFAI